MRTVYFVEVFNEFGESEFRRGYGSKEQRQAALAECCRSVWAMDPPLPDSDAKAIAEFFAGDWNYSYWTEEVDLC
jgi:hypothetical protein